VGSAFPGALKMMETLGKLGGSRNVTIYSDGDGDFRPKFTFDETLPRPAMARDMDERGNALYDAG
jgi:hypothetical protein